MQRPLELGCDIVVHSASKYINGHSDVIGGVAVVGHNEELRVSAFGGMISVRLNFDLSQTKKMLEKCRLFTLAESLGGVESLIEHPAIMTHACIPKAQREALGITDSFIRLSVGIETVEDLQANLTNAIKF